MCILPRVQILSALACVSIAYLCGAIPTGLWLGRLLRGVDVRTLGSGNLGATNVYRSLGPGIGVATLLLDIAKGALPVALLPNAGFAADFPGGAEWCRLACGLAAIAGHVWSVFAGFQGGKGVATAAGVLLALSPFAFAVVLGVFILTVAITRWISLGSILGAIAFAATLGVIAPGGVQSPTFAFSVLVALLVILRHKDNIGRLLAGTERRFSLRRGSGS